MPSASRIVPIGPLFDGAAVADAAGAGDGDSGERLTATLTTGATT